MKKPARLVTALNSSIVPSGKTIARLFDESEENKKEILDAINEIEINLSVLTVKKNLLKETLIRCVETLVTLPMIETSVQSVIKILEDDGIYCIKKPEGFSGNYVFSLRPKGNQ